VLGTRAIEAAEAAHRLAAVARDGLGRRGGRDREQAAQQERGKREQRYAGLDVSSSVIRVKN
jgi:hypothetical protein